MCVFVYARACVQMCVCVCVCPCSFICVSVCLYIHKGICVCVCVCVSLICVYPCSFVCASVLVCVTMCVPMRLLLHSYDPTPLDLRLCAALHTCGCVERTRARTYVRVRTCAYAAGTHSTVQYLSLQPTVDVRPNH